MKTQAIIPAAGLGRRLKSVRPKPLVMLNGKPLTVHTLMAFEETTLIDGIILVVHEDHFLEFEDIVKQFYFKKVEKIVIGGATRLESVANGLKMLHEDTDVVVIHDGARPLIKPQIIREAVMLCRRHEAVVAAVPVKPTLKRVDTTELFVKETLNRDEIWEIQTPQAFKKEILLKAYAQKTEDVPTDDAALVERLGVRIKVLRGDYRNIKVTTNEDLTIAEAFFALYE